MQLRSLGREDPLRRAWLPTAVFLPGESQDQKSLAGNTESDTTKETWHAHIWNVGEWY